MCHIKVIWLNRGTEKVSNPEIGDDNFKSTLWNSETLVNLKKCEHIMEYL